MCELQLTMGIMSRTALFKTLCVKGGTHPFFVHCLGQQQRVLRPGQEAVSAVYCLARRPLGVVASVPGCHATRPQEPHDDQALHAGWLCDHAQGTPGLALCGDGPW